MTNVTILVTKPNDLIISQIVECAKKLKSLKIVTDNINSFLPLEETLYCDFGIAVQVTNNKGKAISAGDIIINFDFNKSQLNKYCFPREATIINIQNLIMSISDKFKGTIINDYKIKYNEEILDDFEYKNDFDEKILYESLICRRDTYSNIKKQLEMDNVKLTELVRV